MLHTETVEGATLQLLRSLLGQSELSGFALVGGTALALLMGHRKSVDLDLFARETFDRVQLGEFLQQNYGFKEDFSKGYTLKGTINGIKIDCIRHAYPYIHPDRTTDGIRMYSTEDIAAMKLLAIKDNGSRLKDFVDVAFLSTRLSLCDILRGYSHKYPDSNSTIALKALTYFEDIDFGQSVVLCGGRFEWELVRQRLLDMCRHQDRIYPDFPLLKD